METQFPQWLKSLGQRRRDMPPVDRGLPFSHLIRYSGDVTTWQIVGTVKASPDAATELATFTISAPTYDADTGLTAWVATLTPEQTLALGGANFEGVTQRFFDFVISESEGANPRRLMAGIFPISGFVTELS